MAPSVAERGGAVEPLAIMEELPRSVKQALSQGFEGQDLMAQACEFQRHVDQLVRFSGPAQDPLAYRRSQVATQEAAKPLLYAARLAPVGHAARHALLTALSRLCAASSEAAGLVASCGLLKDVALAALVPIEEAEQQEEHLALLQLLRTVAQAVPEAPVLGPLMPEVASLVGDERPGLPPFSMVRATAIEVLTAATHGRRHRAQVAGLLSASALRRATEVALAADASPSCRLAVGLLLANVCELPAPQGCEAITFGDFGKDFWAKAGFFDDLAQSLAASLKGRPWPPEEDPDHPARSWRFSPASTLLLVEEASGHRDTWKLAAACARLASAGFVADLRACLAPLADLVVRAAPGGGAQERRGAEGVFAEGQARAARCAVEALLSMMQEPEVGDQIVVEDAARDGRLRAALGASADQAEDPPALELLEQLVGARRPEAKTGRLVEALRFAYGAGPPPVAGKPVA